MDFIERQEKIMELAQEDMAYQTWSGTYSEAISEFSRYADQQPEEIQSLLRAYAEGGRLMYQRLFNLACLHMRFPDENQSA